MLQRIQTVYLTLALLLLVVSCALPLAIFEPAGMGGTTKMNMLCLSQDGQILSYLPATMLVIISLAVICAVMAILGYKDLKKQVSKCNYTIIAELLWVINYALYSLLLVDDATFRPSFGAILPVIALILTFLGRKGVKADRKLLHDSERIR